MPQPVVAEIAYGIQRLPRSKRREALAARFALLKREIPRLVWTDEVSAAFGSIKAALGRKGQRIEDLDAAIAAHALAHDCVLVSGNIEHMARIQGLEVEDWTRPSDD